MPLPVDTPAPDFKLTADHGREVTLAELTADGPALLAFFKTTCGTCEVAFPVYGELERHYGDAVPVVGIAQDPLDTARPWLDEHRFSGPVLDDAAGNYQVSADYELDAVPTLVLVGRDGRIAAVSEGWDREEANRLAERLAELTGRDPVTVSDEGDGRPAFKPG